MSVITADDKYDVYVCYPKNKKKEDHNTTIIARFSSEDHEYGSYSLDILRSIKERRLSVGQKCSETIKILILGLERYDQLEE